MSKNQKRPYVLSIAGFDPSGGAGIIADAKTFESHKTQGLTAITCITYQSESNFYGLQWLSFIEIKKQLEALFNQYKIDVVKIGLIKNLDMLAKIVNYIKVKNTKCKIIWDPIIASSTGFVIHNTLNTKKLISILSNIYLITPNISEAIQLLPKFYDLAKYTNLLCKSYIQNKTEIADLLIHNKTHYIIHHKRTNFSKHGTGCVLSAGIAANLAYKKDLITAYTLASNYLQEILTSNKTNLAYHIN